MQYTGVAHPEAPISQASVGKSRPGVLPHSVGAVPLQGKAPPWERPGRRTEEPRGVGGWGIPFRSQTFRSSAASLMVPPHSAATDHLIP